MEIKSWARKLVKPALPSPCRIHELSNLDQWIPEQPPVPVLLLFRHDGSSSNFMSTTILESSLSHALSEFYPLAGRIKTRENGRSYVECNDKGVEFVEAFATCKLADFRDFQPFEGYDLLNPLHFPQESNEDAPIMSIQLTRFECGGVGLTLCISHRVADGQAYGFFLNKWRNVTLGTQLPEVASFNNDRLRSRKQPRQHYTFPVQWVDANPEVTSLGIQAQKNLASKIFTLGLESIQILRERLQAPGSAKVTRFAALATHVWSCVCEARCMDASQDSRLLVAVNCRPRFHPPLPVGHVGNAVLTTTITSSVQELLQDPQSTANSIQKALVAVDEEYIMSWIDRLEMGEIKSMSFDASKDVEITTWLSFSFNSMDFGWGKPVFVGLGTYAMEFLLIVLVPGQGPGDVNVIVTGMPKEQLEKLGTAILRPFPTKSTKMVKARL